MKNQDISQFTAKLAETIHAERKQRGLSHERLAEKAGLTRQAVSHLEGPDSNPTVTSLLKLADALEMDLSDLIKRVEAK